MGIGYKERNFKKYLENHFGIRLPANVEIFYARGVRIGNTEIIKSHIDGELGYAACDFGFNPTNALIMNFGHLARKNYVDMEEKEAIRFVKGENIALKDRVAVTMGAKNKYVIVKFDGNVIGLGHYDKERKMVFNKVPEKTRREI